MGIREVSRGLIGFKATNYTVECSNHFLFGKPTFQNGVPAFYMSVHNLVKPSPNKQRKLNYKIDVNNSTIVETDLIDDSNSKSFQCLTLAKLL